MRLGHDVMLLEQALEVQRAGRALAVDLEFLLCARAFRLTWRGRMRRIRVRHALFDRVVATVLHREFALKI